MPKMSFYAARWSAVWLAVILSSKAAAAPWFEVGDARDLPAVAQEISGTGVLASISGTINALDIDMYEFRVPGPAALFATIVPVAGANLLLHPQIFLFDSDGLGVIASDSVSTGTASFFIGLSVGNYFLAISPHNLDPFTMEDAHGRDFRLFPTFGSSVGPTGPGGSEPIGGWGGTFSGIVSPYRVRLTGAAFISAPAAPPIPEPTTLALLGLGLTGLALTRSKPHSKFSTINSGLSQAA